MPNTLIQDTIDFVVSAEKTIVNDTVRMQTGITAIITDDSSEEALRADIRAAMKSFIDTEWRFSDTTRVLDTSGFERLTIRATARVSEAENYNLDERCKNASRKGLTICTPTVDTSIPQAMLDKAEKELRMTIITNVGAECKTIAEATGRPYRIGKLNFGTGLNSFSNNMRAATSSNTHILMAGIAKTAYGSDGIGDEADTLGNASKLTMTASVSLAVDSTTTGSPINNVEHLVQPVESI